MLNERKLERQQVVYNFAVTELQSGQFVGYLYDININGMQLTNVTQSYLYQTFVADILLPEYICGENHIIVEVECKWFHELELQSIQCAGFSFCHVDSLVSERIGRLIQQFNYPVRARPYRLH